MKPYSLMSPDLVGQNVVSGGVRVMWGLYGWLLSKGQIAYMNRRVQADTIAIYPEIVNGNPFNAKTVVRYILAPLGEMSSNGIPGPTSYPPTDKIYSFSRIVHKTDEKHTMFLPILNLHIFKDQHRKRTKKAVLFGKGKDLGLHPKDCIIINRAFAQDQQKLADFLNECEVLYSYDHRSAMFEVARLCGCRVVVLSDKLKDFSLYEPGINGLGWKKDKKLDTARFRKHYEHLVSIFERKLERFINETQN